MHHIKRQARSQAWYHNDDPENKTYNPFARVGKRSNTSRRDEENGLYHANTENDVVLTNDNDRIAKNEEGLTGYGGPQKAGTFPQGPSRGLSSNNNDNDNRERGNMSSGSAEKPSEEESSLPEYAQPQRELSRGLSSTNNTTNEDGGAARNRKGGKLMAMFHSKNKEEIDSSDSDTQRSKKKKKYPKIPFMQQVKAVLYSWVNVLLIFVPVGIALEYAHVNKIIVFVSDVLGEGNEQEWRTNNPSR